MFFAKPYSVEPCGMFTWGHFLLLSVTLALIALGLYLSRRLDERGVRRVIRVVTSALWVLEIVKIVFVLVGTGSRNPNDFVPLYFCSLTLYAGALSSLCRGFWRRVGDVFLATGGIVGGASFLAVPNTSLPRYPMFHFISLHSFLLHGLMVFVGLLLLTRGAMRLRARDVWSYAALVSVMCVCAFVFNTAWGQGANLMFVSHDFPGTPVATVYRLTGKVFPAAMWLIQAFPPFYAVYGAQRLAARRKS